MLYVCVSVCVRVRTSSMIIVIVAIMRYDIRIHFVGKHMFYSRSTCSAHDDDDAVCVCLSVGGVYKNVDSISTSPVNCGANVAHTHTQFERSRLAAAAVCTGMCCFRFGRSFR